MTSTVEASTSLGPTVDLAAELQGVSRSFTRGTSTVRAAQDVSLRFERGQFVSIIGPSGAGKTTVLQILGGIERPDAGSVRVGTTDLLQLNERDLARLRRQRVGFVFQHFHLLPSLQAWENVAMTLSLDGVARRHARERALAVLDVVGLTDRAHHRPGELSGGEMQRVAVARALVNNPDIVLADEPTGNLDTRTGHQVLELLRELVDTNGTTVVMVTHSSAADSITDRTIEFIDGQVALDSAA